MSEQRKNIEITETVEGEVVSVTADEIKIRSWQAVQFIRAPSSRFFGWTVILMCSAAVTCLFLSTFIRADVDVNGRGEIISNSGVREAVTNIDGFITQINKQVGDEVEEDAIVGVMATDGLSEADVSVLTDTLTRLLNQIENVQHADHLTVVQPNLMTEKIYDHALLQAMVNIELGFRNFHSQSSQVNVGMNKELSPVEERLKILRAKRVSMQKSNQREFLQFYIEANDEEIGRLEAQLATNQNQTHGKLDQDLSTLVQAVRFGLGELKSYYGHHQIHAPISGTVIKVDVGPNTHLLPNKSIMTILPKNASFVARIRVPSKDIVKIKKDQKILYKVDAYPYQRYGLFEGTVLSLDEIKSDGSGETTEVKTQLVNESGEKMTNDEYFVRGTIHPPHLVLAAEKENFKFVVGMPLQASVVIQNKSLSEVILEKIFPNLR